MFLDVFRFKGRTTSNDCFEDIAQVRNLNQIVTVQVVDLENHYRAQPKLKKLKNRLKFRHTFKFFVHGVRL